MPRVRRGSGSERAAVWGRVLSAGPPGNSWHHNARSKHSLNLSKAAVPCPLPTLTPELSFPTVELAAPFSFQIPTIPPEDIKNLA